MKRRTVLCDIGRGGRLALKEDHPDLLAAKHDAAKLVLRIVAVSGEVRVDAGEEGAQHAPAVAHVVVAVVPREREDVARQERDYAVCRAEHEQLGCEGDDLELGDRCLKR